MSAAPPHRDAEMLARLAELDLAAAEHVHAALIAATGADDVANLSRAWQRTARSLRQTLALKIKATREAAQAAARAASDARWAARTRGVFRDPEAPIADRITDLQDAVGRIACQIIPDPEAREALFDRFDVELDDWREAEDFLTVDLDAQVLRACRLLDLPEDLAAHWRDLPDPPDEPDDDDVEGEEGEPISDLNVVRGVHYPPWSPSG